MCPPEVLPALSGWLFLDLGYSFAGLIVEEGVDEWFVRYVFYGQERTNGYISWRRLRSRRKTFPASAGSYMRPIGMNAKPKIFLA